MNMSTSASARSVRVPASNPPSAGSLRSKARVYFASDIARSLQTALAVIWLLDGGLQFQSFMYSKGFTQMLTGMTAGQPSWLASSMDWAAHTAGHNLTVFNTLFALVQVAIGVGLLYGPTVRAALMLSIAWSIFVWWFGEAFGMLLMSMASPLTGAPGAVSLYALLALVAWPNGRAGGLLGVRGARIAWATLWVLMAVLWLEAPSSNPNAITSAINSAPSGMSWLSTVQNWAASAAQGNGVPIALVACALSLVIGLGVALDWRARPLLKVSIGLSLIFWIVGQGFGGIVQGGATDPNAAPLFVLFAWVLHALLRSESSAAGLVSGPPKPSGVTAAAGVGP
jgi:hypothetical protein